VRRVEAIKAQPVRNCKGLARDGLTMPFLEEGGYFDLPIKVALLNIFDLQAAADAAAPCQQLHNTFFAFARNVRANQLLYQMYSSLFA